MNVNCKDKSLVLIDDSNVYYGFKKYRWQLDYEKFYYWLRSIENMRKELEKKEGLP